MSFRTSTHVLQNSSDMSVSKHVINLSEILKKIEEIKNSVNVVLVEQVHGKNISCFVHYNEKHISQPQRGVRPTFY